VKGYPQSAPFAMGKFALRGLAQSMRVSWRRRAFTSRILSSMGRSETRGGSKRLTSQTRCSIPTRSPRPTFTCSGSGGVLGHGRSNSGHGLNASDDLRSTALCNFCDRCRE
jgi:hypothetical protein